MSLIKRSMTIAAHKTSLALEPEYWDALNECAKRENLSRTRLIARIDRARAETHPDRPLASAARVYVLQDAQRRARG